MFKTVLVKMCLTSLLVCFSTGLCQSNDNEPDEYGQWMAKPQSEWPQITMINQIEYTDNNHPIAGCGFLLDTGDEVLAATAKHILIYFKSDSMKTVSFDNTLKLWKMFPKDNPDDVVVVGELINENKEELLGEAPTGQDWLLFTLKKRSQNIQPLKLRSSPMQEGETVYIIGWRYSDKDCPQVIYEGNFVRSEEGSFLITTKELEDNTMPGLSGSPVIDSRGYLLGLMSQKAEKMERPSSTDYPKMLIGRRTNAKE
ncbi:MAG: serine protease [candidate division Zixibacteria bacterium]|nr:serine protease [candidate division Zixibacteria bacterium]